MVPPNWQHPTNERGHEQPMHNEHIDDAMAEWLETFDRLRRGEKGEYEDSYFDASLHPEGPLCAWLNDAGIPDPAYCRPWKDEEATWFQVWETVTEGTPVTPPFATKAELVDWLVNKGEMHGTEYERRYSREEAQAFAEDEWAPSMIMSVGATGNQVIATGCAVPLALKDLK